MGAVSLVDGTIRGSYGSGRHYHISKLYIVAYDCGNGAEHGFLFVHKTKACAEHDFNFFTVFVGV